MLMPMPEREIFVNKGRDRYQRCWPTGFLPSFVDNVVSPVLIDNLYYLYPEREGAGVPTITGYQEWAEKGWKEKHGTFQASARFMRKLFEEIQEVDEADCLLTQSGCDPESKEAADLAGELGDVMWCATALASNSSADIDAAMKLKLLYQVAGVGMRKELDTLKPPWHDTVALVGTKWEDIELTDISAMVVHGYEPLKSTVMNVPHDEPEFEIGGHISAMGDAALSVWSTVRNQFCDGAEDEIDKGVHDYRHYTPTVAEFTADIYLNVAYVAYHRLGMSLEEVVIKNMTKLNARIVAGRIDKTDGERGESLL